jgi:hypothetical protein
VVLQSRKRERASFSICRAYGKKNKRDGFSYHSKIMTPIAYLFWNGLTIAFGYVYKSFATSRKLTVPGALRLLFPSLVAPSTKRTGTSVPHDKEK